MDKMNEIESLQKRERENKALGQMLSGIGEKQKSMCNAVLYTACHAGFDSFAFSPT